MNLLEQNNIELLDGEEFRQTEYEGYWVSNMGRVYSEKSKRLLKPYDNNHGYLLAGISVDGVFTPKLIHRLVATAFIPKPDVDYFLDINHKDECKSNNCVWNLEWCSRDYNTNYGTRNARVKETMKSKWAAKYKEDKGIKVMCLENGKIYLSMKDAVHDIGFNYASGSTYSRIREGKPVRGFHFQIL